ncbi:MAG: hypothetical protein PHI27_04935 [Eubacteriales bacterium]|nr:hypothetical protein [Eubacteriales bacterium]MDD3881577.1 hypothetical protein [Eubacteriales bacterium]MDD4513353.1 hypothetical protein [Eubacteriales bacterium]
MVYFQCKERISLPVDEVLHLSDIGMLLKDSREEFPDAEIKCPAKTGVYKLTGGYILSQLPPEMRDRLTIVGNASVYVHREKPRSGKAVMALKYAFVCLVLLCGSALAMAWFHADVDMASAQANIYTYVSGSAPENELFISLPYALGVGVGVALFYAVTSKRRTSPLIIKMNSYRSEQEEAQAITVERSTLNPT